MIKQDELYTVFIENGFDTDFEFLGKNKKTYIFNTSTFNILCKEYGEDNVIEYIQDDIKEMISHEICSLKQ